MKPTNPLFLTDFYKQSHANLYEDDVEKIYSTWTPRSKISDELPDEVIVFGIQWFIKKYLIDYFNENFFNRPKHAVISEYQRMMLHTIGNSGIGIDRVSMLHDLGYLPIRIKALPEGTRCPLKCPYMTIENTDHDFFWLTNFLETLISCELWKPATSATIADQYKKIFKDYSDLTCDDDSHIMFQGHDFSMRGMSGIEASAISGAGHLLSFYGTDTIPAITLLEDYYNASVVIETIGASIPATEHSIMCCNSATTVDGDPLREYEAFKRIITKVHPSGYVAVVSDTWNIWNIMSDVLPKLRGDIMARDGKLVIRPDSGDPVKIVLGNPESDNEYERKGVIRCLAEIFGTTTNSKGYKVLDSHIGCIYGDAITLERAERICDGLANMGFASSNIVFGIGSYTYNYNTRDTFGFAMKSTYAIRSGEPVQLYKNPVTDNGKKKSQKGMVAVLKPNDKLVYVDGLVKERLDDLMNVVFEDGRLYEEQSLSDIRSRIKQSL